ncbi:MAG TPA: hypothetical protein EYP58_02440 [bacterium (Candidatus Stahlbacteria)]|nr:hypothetical protein [Candidatus Stahlbacteria bacterium]
MSIERALKSWLSGEPLGMIKKVIEGYSILEIGETFVVGVSGGIDSFAMLMAVETFNQKFDMGWEIIPCFVDGGFPGTDAERLRDRLAEFGFELKVRKAPIFKKLKKNKKNICFLCTRARRRELVEEAMANFSSKVAFAHHKEDVVEALFLNLIYNRELATMIPNQGILQGRIQIIRPIYNYDKRLIKRIASFFKYKPIAYSCPFRRLSKRTAVRKFLTKEVKELRNIENIFYGMTNFRWPYLP